MGAAVARVIRDQEPAQALVDPVRRRLLEQLVEPDSAAGLARRSGLPRQRVNYHLRELEHAGLLKLVDERKRGNCTERIVQATAATYVISPEVLGGLGTDPTKVADKRSWAYLVAVAARAIRELAVLRERADAVNKPLPTLTLHEDVRFESQADLNAFSEELANAVAALTAKYARGGSDPDASGGGGQQQQGRVFRFFIGAYPAITKTEDEARAEAEAAAEGRRGGPEGKGAVS